MIFINNCLNNKQISLKLSYGPLSKLCIYFIFISILSMNCSFAIATNIKQQQQQNGLFNPDEAFESINNEHNNHVHNRQVDINNNNNNNNNKASLKSSINNELNKETDQIDQISIFDHDMNLNSKLKTINDYGDGGDDDDYEYESEVNRKNDQDDANVLNKINNKSTKLKTLRSLNQDSNLKKTKQENKESSAASVRHYSSDSIDIGQISADEKVKTMEQFLDRLLHESVYDRRIRPSYKDGKDNQPVVVKINMHINTISAINEVQMEYSVDCYFRQEWIDPRLNYANSSWSHVGDIALHYDLVNKVWTSDAFFRNSKDAKAHTITVPNRLMRIHPDGKVLYSQRLTLKLECPMKLQKFPLDNQTCIINIGSYGYTTKDLKFIWNRGSDKEKKDPVTINSKLEMPDFSLKEYISINCDRATTTGSYACLEVSFVLQRDLSVYINEFYIPSSFIVSLSFVSFFIDHKSAAARAPLGAMSVLTVTTMLSGAYACLEVHFHLTRSFGYYMVQVYIPSILTCLIAFVSFWIDHKAVPARISVGLLTVLTITTQSSGIRSQLPRVSYIKAIDVWMSACLVFVFAALLEYAVVNVIARKQELKKQFRMSKQRKKNKKLQKAKLQATNNPNEKVLVIGNRLANVGNVCRGDQYEQTEIFLNGSHSHQLKKSFENGHNESFLSCSLPTHFPNTPSKSLPPSPQPSSVPVTPQPPPPKLPLPTRDDAQMVDFLSSFLFPISFIIFNIIYWMFYLNMQVVSGN